MSNIVKKNKDLIPLSMQEVEDRIAVIRNQEVIADADVAYLYGVETRVSGHFRPYCVPYI